MAIINWFFTIEALVNASLTVKAHILTLTAAILAVITATKAKLTGKRALAAHSCWAKITN